MYIQLLQLSSYQFSYSISDYNIYLVLKGKQKSNANFGTLPSSSVKNNKVLVQTNIRNNQG